MFATSSAFRNCCHRPARKRNNPMNEDRLQSPLHKPFSQKTLQPCCILSFNTDNRGTLLHMATRLKIDPQQVLSAIRQKLFGINTNSHQKMKNEVLHLLLRTVWAKWRGIRGKGRERNLVYIVDVFSWWDDSPWFYSPSFPPSISNTKEKKNAPCPWL